MAIKEKVDGVPFRTAYGQKMRVAIATGDGLTEQHHKDETDINKIVHKYNKTGLLDHVNQFEEKYADVSGFDYQQAMEKVASANSMFEAMPSEIRNRFNNSPAEFIDFCNDENNQDEMVALGLATKKEFTPPVDDTPKGVVKASESAETEVKTEG